MAGGGKSRGPGMIDLSKVKRQPIMDSAVQIQEIRAKIPKHYFEQNTLWGFYYVARDLIQVAIVAYVMKELALPFVARLQLTGLASLAVNFVLWNVFWFFQGLSFTGLWVLAHECGHGGFSPSGAINEAVGTVLHSALLVPFHPWRMSHAQHHHFNNHCDKDTVFVPRKEPTALSESIEAAPIVSFLQIIMMLTVGWPGYLLFNAAGQQHPRRANHFEPSSPVFPPGHRSEVVQSDIVLLLVVAVLGYASYTFGFAAVMQWYGVPYLWCNAWLVYITYMQHSDVRVPHYDDVQWNYVRGALATVDRNFGWLINWWLHHIHDSHVVHHLFSNMPFYNAIEVTRKHIRPILGEHYLRDDRHLWTMLWESWRNCMYVVPSDGVAFFRS